MTLTPFPASPYCRVRARVAAIWADGPDDGTHPDWKPAAGEKVTLTPSISAQLLVYDATGPNPIIVTVERVDCVVDAEGWLTKSDGHPVYIAPTDDPLLSATGWTWTAGIKGKSVPFAAPSGGVVDLALFIAAPATDATKVWVERIPELVDAAGNLVSIDTVTVDAGDIVVALTNGTVNRFPIPEGTPGAPGEKGDPGAPGEKGDPGGPYAGINAQTTAYTLIASDAGKLVTVTAAAAVDVTVPPGVFTVGQRVDVLDLGAERVTFVAGAGMTLNGTPTLVSRAQYSAHSVVFLSASSAVVVGDLEAA